MTHYQIDGTSDRWPVSVWRVSLTILQSLLYLYIVILDTPRISDTSLHEKETPVLSLFETWVLVLQLA